MENLNKGMDSDKMERGKNKNWKKWSENGEGEGGKGSIDFVVWS